ncbi:MAG: DNA repair protein RecN [Bacillaceae bacterium]|nr:DNA repair protein RecN [Bacillaceae bacterium]
MLAELSIKDFAIIDQVQVQFREGLTVLTGETGAGKSIIIDAIQLLAGGRGSVEFVRHGAKRADIQGLFYLDSSDHRAYEKAEQFGIEIDEEGMLVLHRIITAQGKSICRVNGKLVTLAILKEFGQTLIDIHTQHETQSLMDSDRHGDLLDLYDQQHIAEAKREYRQLFHDYKKIQKRYEALQNDEQEIVQRLDLLQFQLKELEEANLQENEDTRLEEERNILSNYEKIYQNLNDAYEALYGEDKGLDWLSHAMTSLENIKAYDDELAKKAEQMTNQYYIIEELAFDMRNKLEEMEFDPNRLNEVEGRLNELNRLKRKYGQSVQEMLEYAAKIEEEIDQLQNKDSHLQQLEIQMKDNQKDALLEAEQLHKLRRQAAERLKNDISRELKDLYLDKAEFDVEFTFLTGKDQDPQYAGRPVRLTENGFEQITFVLSTNPGEPLKELQKIASGGELSRIMLALKKIFAKHQGVTSVIFDEVDTGVSGRVAQAMAEKIYDISNRSQVLCITHLPQVAAMADTHMLIEKQVSDNRTSTKVKELNHEEKIDEISRMMTGAELTETTKDHARELLDQAEKHKKLLPS